MLEEELTYLASCDLQECTNMLYLCIYDKALQKKLLPGNGMMVWLGMVGCEPTKSVRDGLGFQKM